MKGCSAGCELVVDTAEKEPSKAASRLQARVSKLLNFNGWAGLNFNGRAGLNFNGRAGLNFNGSAGLFFNGGLSANMREHAA